MQDLSSRDFELLCNKAEISGGFGTVAKNTLDLLKFDCKTQ